MTKKIRKTLFFVLPFLVFFLLSKEFLIIEKSFDSGMSLLYHYFYKHFFVSLLPAFLIAGLISAFLDKDQILKYLGGKTKKYISYSIASFSGAILTVCSCTILPLFAGIKKRGAGLGPAITFLFSGPAINIVAVFLTVSVLGTKLGFGRIFFAIVISIITGLTMQFIYKEKGGESEIQLNKEKNEIKKIPLFILIFSLLGIIIVKGINVSIFLKNSIITLLLFIIFVVVLFFLKKENSKIWIKETLNFVKLLFPILFFGIFIAGFISPLLPPERISGLVGENTIFANFIASFFGVFLYFSTLTEVPILEILIKGGMNNGPAMALLLAGPSLSLPNLLVIRRILGNIKTITYASLVIFYSMIAGLIFGYFFS